MGRPQEHSEFQPQFHTLQSKEAEYHPWKLFLTPKVYKSLLSEKVQGTQGFLLRPEKGLESPSARLEARFPYHDSRATESDMTEAT